MANEKMIADKNYYRDADDNLVEESDPKAAFLVAGKGTEISAETAKKYGIKIKAETETDKTSDESGEKASSPAENKSVHPSENKSKKKK